MSEIKQHRVILRMIRLKDLPEYIDDVGGFNIEWVIDF